MLWAKAWLLFWAEIVLIELPFRVGVLSQDLQAHDAHHMEHPLVFEAEVLDTWVDDWRNQPFFNGVTCHQNRNGRSLPGAV
jgi:hypothetical protein